MQVIVMPGSMTVVSQRHFVYYQNVIAEDADGLAVARIAAAIGEPARARMLYCLMDGHARTSTELAVAAEVSPSTASVHLNRLKAERLVKVLVQGKHRYYSLDGPNVASALEGLSVLAGGSRVIFRSDHAEPAARARTCYDHMAGTLGVSLHDRFHRWDGSLQTRLRPANTKSPPRAPRLYRLWASISTQPALYAGGLLTPASIGANGAPIWLARWARPS